MSLCSRYTRLIYPNSQNWQMVVGFALVQAVSRANKDFSPLKIFVELHLVSGRLAK